MRPLITVMICIAGAVGATLGLMIGLALHPPNDGRYDLKGFEAGTYVSRILDNGTFLLGNRLWEEKIGWDRYESPCPQEETRR